jgi:D-cysteine desulfhydrase
LPWLVARHTHGFTPPYVLPAGGSSPLGTLGYVECGLELADQVARGLLPEPGWIVTAVGSGGTAAGLALGLRLAGPRTRVRGIVFDVTLRLDSAALVGLAGKSRALLRARGADLPQAWLGPADVVTERGWLGPGYARPTAFGAWALHRARPRPAWSWSRVHRKGARGAHRPRRVGRFGGEPVAFLNTFGPR